MLKPSAVVHCRGFFLADGVQVSFAAPSEALRCGGRFFTSFRMTRFTPARPTTSAQTGSARGRQSSALPAASSRTKVPAPTVRARVASALAQVVVWTRTVAHAYVTKDRFLVSAFGVPIPAFGRFPAACVLLAEVTVYGTSSRRLWLSRGASVLRARTSPNRPVLAARCGTPDQPGRCPSWA